MSKVVLLVVASVVWEEGLELELGQEEPVLLEVPPEPGERVLFAGHRLEFVREIGRAHV